MTADHGSPPAAIIERIEADGFEVAADWIRARLLTGSAATVPSVTTRAPFPYHWIPGTVRMRVMNRLLLGAFRRARRDVRFPDLYAENGLDLVASRRGDRPANGWRWPEGRGCAFVLSHDTDTCRESSEIRRLADLSRALDLRSTFMFVGRCIERYGELMRELTRDGFEVGLHDVVHDNRVAFLPEERIRERLGGWCRTWGRELGVSGYRSPSWYVSPALWRALDDLGFSYDCSVQDTHFLHDSWCNLGAATYYPFVVGNLVVMPNTIPFDMPWALGVDKAETTRFWRPKIDHIAARGGLIMINAHPARWFCGNDDGVAALEECARYVLERHRPWCATAAQIAEHVRGEVGGGGCAA